MGVRGWFNENDPYCAGWLRNLYPAATVDERDIREVEHVDGSARAHFFAGIGGWEHALSLAGWPASLPVWTGSCPCQPFSAAGRRRGESDERHLWPEFRRLIEDGRPAICFGEQVASAAGRDWLARVRADLEVLGYAVGAADLAAASVGAPHIRQRLYWVAYADGRADKRGESRTDEWTVPTTDGGNRGLEQPASDGREQRRAEPVGRGTLPRCGNSGLVDTASRGYEAGHGYDATGPQSFWADYELIPCLDGKARRTQPGLFPLAHGVSGRVAILRAFGNAIVPPVAATFVRAFMQTVSGERGVVGDSDEL